MNWKLLVEERDEWVDHNFPTDYIPAPGESVIGMIEETGELAHVWLKNLQSIRLKDGTYEGLMRDAIGDITIYMLGVLSHIQRVPERVPPIRCVDVNMTIRRLASYVGQLSDNPCQYYCEQIVACLKRICKLEGWNYEATVMLTWREVQRRDWIKYPDTGFPDPAKEPDAYARAQGLPPLPTPDDSRDPLT